MYIRLTMCIMNMPGDYCIIYDFGQRRHGLKKLGTGSCSFQTNTCKFLKAKLVFKTISDVYCEFLYCMCREIICNLLIGYSLYISLRKEIALQNALRYNYFALFSPATISQFILFLRQTKIYGWAVAPPPTTTPLISGIKWDKTYCSLHK